MKKFVLVAMLAAVVVAGEKPPAPAGTDSQKDGSFVTAQRYCPNGRC